MTAPRTFASSRVIAPPLRLTPPSSTRIAPLCSMELVPALMLRSPSVRSIPAIVTPSFSIRLTVPEPEVTLTAPRMFAPSKVIDPPLRLTAPSSTRIAPLWLMALVPAFKLRSPSVRVIPATEIASFSARLIDPEPEVTVTAPRTFAPSKVMAPPVM